jgi:hypothetical protein
MLPVTRLTPWYPGQFGVYGSDVPRGIRVRTEGIVLYVDGGHPEANNNNDGTNPDAPKATIQAAVSSPWLVQGSTILVAPGTYEEEIVIPATAPPYCTLAGAGPSYFSPSIETQEEDEAAIQCSALGWTFTNFRVVGEEAAAGIHLLKAAGTEADNTIIDHVQFYGAGNALYGVALDGAPKFVTIRDCLFTLHEQGGDATGIAVTDFTVLEPLQCLIEDNRFIENENHIVGEFNWSVIRGNVLATGTGVVVGDYIDISGGTDGGNTVYGNVFEGTYTEVGGYTAHAADNWTGNIAEDLAPATVGDNGLTIARPA